MSLSWAVSERVAAWMASGRIRGPALPEPVTDGCKACARSRVCTGFAQPLNEPASLPPQPFYWHVKCLTDPKSPAPGQFIPGYHLKQREAIPWLPKGLRLPPVGSPVWQLVSQLVECSDFVTSVGFLLSKTAFWLVLWRHSPPLHPLFSLHFIVAELWGFFNLNEFK